MPILKIVFWMRSGTHDEAINMSGTAALFPLPPSPQNLPLFRLMGPTQTEALLVRNCCGRIAFTLGGRVQMLPINYVYVNGWIYGRTAAAAYLPRNVPVAFEVDERNNAFEWRSVVIQGRLELVESKNPENASGGWTRLMSTLRALFAPSGDEAAAVLFRDQLFCIRVTDMSGRASLPDKTRSYAS